MIEHPACHRQPPGWTRLPAPPPPKMRGEPRIFEGGAGGGLAQGPPPWHPALPMACRLLVPAALAALSACTCSPAPGGARDQAAPPPTTPVAQSTPTPTAPTGPAGPTVRPPFRCVEGADMPAPGLLKEAEAALDAGQDERALGCADETLRVEPRSVRALVVRGEALAALDQVKEAQLALTRALAVDPADPAALAAAADLHVRRLEGAHDALEAGVELALRGLRSLTRVPRRDPALRLRLELSAAAGLNDLGRAGEALPHAERAVALDGKEPAASNELGFALFELCRFDEARRAFERSLAAAPADGWALHHLGLLAERRGEAAEAARLLERARAAAPQEFPPELAITPEAFRAELDRAVSELPARDRAALRGVPVEVADLPDLADLTLSDPPLSPTILGLFRGPPEGEGCLPEDGDPCRSIVLYRKNLARFTHDRAELDRQVRVTLSHELGHLRGEDDDALRDRGLQ
jgi:tetratricopeptide (TPR) repeat protein